MPEGGIGMTCSKTKCRKGMFGDGTDSAGEGMRDYSIAIGHSVGAGIEEECLSNG